MMLKTILRRQLANIPPFIVAKEYIKKMHIYRGFIKKSYCLFG